MTEPLPRTYVYVDGFNFYYGAVRDTAYKWCDLGKLFELLLPNHDIQAIRYFTARAKSRPNDPQVAVRQEVYFRALRTIPTLTLHLGTFRQTTVMAKSADPDPAVPAYVRILKTEEKGSDVNLASYLLSDCYEGRFDVAAVVSNDTDLTTPIRMVTRDRQCPVILINPHRNPARDLAQLADRYLQIRSGVLSVSQFPNQLTDAVGPFHKPPSW